MTTFLDAQFGIKKETTYGTAVVPDRFFEFINAPFKLDKEVVQGSGLRVGARTALSGRRVVPFRSVSGDLELEAVTKGMGVLWEACMGSGSSELVSTGLYQQVFTFADALPSYTVQTGVFDGSVVKPYNWAGCQVGSWSIECPEGDIAKVKLTFAGKSLSTAGSIAAASYPSGMGLFTFAHAAFYAGGTLTPPTTTALAAASGTALATVKGFTLSVDNALQDGPQVGGLPTIRKPGVRAITGAVTVEHEGSTFVDAIIAETPLLLVVTLTNGADVLQIIVPEVKLDGDLPTAGTPERVSHSLNFIGLDNLTAAQPLWIVTRTADTAL